MTMQPDLGEINGLVRQWLTESRPGVFRGHDLAGLWAGVWTAFRRDMGIPMTVPSTVVYDLEFALQRIGIEPRRQPDGRGRMVWTLELPEPAETVAA